MNKYLIFDTETKNKNPESLDINIHDHIPFMVSYIILDENLEQTAEGLFTFKDINIEKIFKKYLNECITIVGANIKYDVHMLLNKGYDKSLFENKHYIDIQVLARLVIKSDLQKDDTFSVALKKLAVKYLGIDSNKEEQELKRELSRLCIDHKNKMKQYFIDLGIWPDNLSKIKETNLLNKLYGNPSTGHDTWLKVYHLYPEFAVARKEFFKNNPRPSYEDCSNVKTYGMTDAVLTCGLFKLWYPKAVQLHQDGVLIRTSAATFPLIMMERAGMTLDLKRLLHDRDLLISELAKTKIISPINGEELTADQNLKLKEVYEFETGLKLNSADSEVRESIMDLSPTARIVDYKKKLGKYLDGYVTRMLEKLTYDNGEYKVYTQYKMSGTVTGRLSSDFQQFPKESLELETGDVIDVRSWFKVPKGKKYMFYFDYSQLELRLQCEWTYLVNGYPDINMARAFMPYRCIDKNGKYYLEETPDVEWKPTDLHALTAKLAFPDIDESSPEWSHYRKLGKRCNFAANYGASPAKIAESLHVDMDTGVKLVNGYKQAFKGVIDFGKWIQRRTYQTNIFPNLFKRIYYSTNKHSLQNWLVQGSGADLLLIKLQQTYEYIKTHPWWQYIITVHDEIGFTCEDIPIDQLKKEVKEIQATMKQSLQAIDVIADIEYTTTNWGEKKDYVEDDLQ